MEACREFYCLESLNIFQIIGGSEVTSTISPTTNSGSVTTSTQAATTSGGGNGGGDLCADPNGFYPHPTDCQKYYQCAHGTPYEYSCASGLLWNDAVKNCDWAANVQCTSGTTASPPTTPTSETTKSPTSTTHLAQSTYVTETTISTTTGIVHYKI